MRRVRSPEGQTELARSWTAYRYVAHAVLAVGVLVILPLAVGAATSLFAGPAGEIRYVGLANFFEILTARGRPLLTSGSFYFVLIVTVAWTVINVVFHLGLGLAFGLLLSRPLLRLKAVYRVLLIIPWAVPNYVTALAWKGMFHRQFGAITGIIQSFNETFGTAIEPISWFSRFSTAFTANIATNVWLGFPFMMVVTIGALTAVPKDVLEAAEVDGATRWPAADQGDAADDPAVDDAGDHPRRDLDLQHVQRGVLGLGRRPRRQDGHPRVGGLSLGVHPGGAVRLRGRVRGAHLRACCWGTTRLLNRWKASWAKSGRGGDDE